jgi:hypothetical protein
LRTAGIPGILLLNWGGCLVGVPNPRKLVKIFIKKIKILPLFYIESLQSHTQQHNIYYYFYDAKVRVRTIPVSGTDTGYNILVKFFLLHSCNITYKIQYGYKHHNIYFYGCGCGYGTGMGYDILVKIFLRHSCNITYKIQCGYKHHNIYFYDA